MIHRDRHSFWALGLAFLATIATMSPLFGQSARRETEQNYLAHLAAANSALRLNESPEARRWLDQIPESARSWEWKFLNARVDSSIQQLSLESCTPVRLDWSADGERLAVAGTDGLVRVYRADSMELITEWKVSEQAIYAARFHPQGQTLAVCSRDGQISLWEMETKKQLWTQKSGGEGLADLVFRPDGNQLLFCSWYRGPQTVLGTVSTWNPVDGQQTWKTDFGVKPIVTARYSPDGKRFAVGTWDALVGVWKTEELGDPKVLDFSDRAQYSAIDDIAFSPDSKQVAAATKNGTPRVWTLDGSAPALDMIGHSNAVFSIAFSATGKNLLTGGSDGVLAVWDLEKRIQTHRFLGHTHRIVSIAVDPNHDRVITAAADKTLRTWDLQAASSFESPQAGKFVYGMVVAHDGTKLVSGGQSDVTITVWDAKSKTALRHFAGTSGTINYLDGDGKDWVAGGNWNGDICIWDISKGEIVKQMGSKELGGMQQCALSDDRRWLASATNKKQVVVWDAQTGEVVKLIPMSAGCWGIEFSSDGKALAVGDGLGVIHWIATANWETLWSCEAGANQINAVRIAKNGEWLAVGTEAGVLSIVDIGSRQVKHRVQGHSERIWCLDISPDGDRLVSGSADRKVKTWDPRTGESILTISDFTESIYNLCYSSDGQSIFVNSLGAKIVKLSTQ